MRKYFLVLPIVTLSACSMFEDPLSNSHGVQTHSGQYQYTSPYGNNTRNYPVGAFAPNQNFPVSSYHSAHSNIGMQGTHLYPYQANRSAGTFPANQGFCCTSGPQHLPAQVPHLRGIQNLGPVMAYGHFSPQPSYNYGWLPPLRGIQHQNTGNYYGTLGGVLYDDDSEIFGIEGRIGYDSGDILGVELEGSIGVINEKNIVNEPSVGNIDLDVKSNYNLAAFAVARAPISEQFSVHGRMGYDVRQLRVNGKAEDGTSETVSGDLKGFAYGAGAEYALSTRSGLRFDVTRYENDVGSIESISASFTRKF